MSKPPPGYWDAVRAATGRLSWEWLQTNFRTIAKTRGYYRTATRLRKQGIPLDVALALLVR